MFRFGRGIVRCCIRPICCCPRPVAPVRRVIGVEIIAIAILILIALAVIF